MNQVQQIQSGRGDVFDTLAAIDRGTFAHDVQDGMKELVQACVGTQKKGKLVIEITVDPDPKTDSVRVSGGVKVALPQKPKKASIFFPQQDGSLTRIGAAQRMIPGTEAEFTGTRLKGDSTPHDPETGEILNTQPQA